MKRILAMTLVLASGIGPADQGVSSKIKKEPRKEALFSRLNFF